MLLAADFDGPGSGLPCWSEGTVGAVMVVAEECMREKCYCARIRRNGGFYFVPNAAFRLLRWPFFSLLFRLFLVYYSAPAMRL